MNRLTSIIAILSLAGVVLLSIWIFTHKQELVYVDSDKLISSYKGMEEARNEYKKKATAWQANIDTLMQEVQNQIKSYEKDASKLTAREKKLTEELIRTKQGQLNDYQQAIGSKAKQEDDQMTRAVLDQINAYLKKFGKDHGYRIIFAATNYGNIAYAEEGIDITNEVLEGLNKEYIGK